MGWALECVAALLDGWAAIGWVTRLEYVELLKEFAPTSLLAAETAEGLGTHGMGGLTTVDGLATACWVT